jgi:uncharacterized protein (DUF2336 family)
MTESLSQADVARLLTNPSAELRAELIAKLARELDGPRLAPQELALAQDIVRTMAKDIEVTVRAALAQSLRHSQQLPHDVALRLAADVEAVALPILTDSLVLTDSDLVELVQSGSPTKQAAIAARPALSEPVSDAIISHADEASVTVLMGNKSAQITEAGLNQAVDRFADSTRVKEVMVRRHTLPITVAERLVVLVSQRLQQHLVRNHALPSSLAADIVLRGRERAVIRLGAGSGERDLFRLVSQMQLGGRLTPTLILRALCMGDLAFFEVAMAVKADVPVANAQTLIHDAGRNGLTSLYWKAGMPSNLLPAIQAAVDVVTETVFDGEPRDLERFRARLIVRVLTRVEDIEAADAEYLIDKLGDALSNAA